MLDHARHPVPRPCACTTVRKASRVLARAYDAALQGAEVNVTQLAVLRAIDRMSGEPVSRVADTLSMDRTSMYRAVEAMARRGWVSMRTGRDARSRSAAITSHGRRVLDGAAPFWERVQSEIIGRFGHRRWHALVAELQALSEIADTVGAEHPTNDAGSSRPS